MRLTLSLLLVLLSPGLAPYEALAAASRDGKLPPKASVPSIPALPRSAVSVQGPAAGTGMGASVPGAAQPGAAVQPPVTTEGALRQAAAKLGGPGAVDADAASTLEGLYTNGFVGGADPTVSAAAPESIETRLGRLSLDGLKAAARDGKADPKDRAAAVKAIADRSDDPSRLALEEIGTERGGSAADYEIKRLALRRLADQGKLLSLPPVSDAHAAEILQSLRDAKPDVVAVDIDGTLIEKARVLDAAAGTALAAAADAGPVVGILTDRPLFQREEGEVGAVEAVTPLTQAQREKIVVGAHRGAAMVRFEPDGVPQSASSGEAWTAEQQAVVADAVDAVVAEAGGSPSGWRAVGAYDAFKLLPAGLTDAQVAALDAKIKAATKGLAATASVRRPRNFLSAPYVIVHKRTKAHGLSDLLVNRDRIRLLADADRLPAFLRPLGRFLAERRAKPAAGGTALAIGDQFFGLRDADADMAIPGARAISVGGEADPRRDGVFVWPTQGPAGTRQLLEAVAFKSKTNAAALTGFFTQRTLGMAVYFPTTVAFAALAIPQLGLPLFGALMAFGSLVGIAMGPLNGMLAKKLSDRGGLMFTQVVRASLHAAVIAAWAFGLLNFWSLLLVAAVNGWILTSIVTVDGITIRHLSGPIFATMNKLAWMNFLVIQVGMGILIGYERFVGWFQKLIEWAGYGLPTGQAALMIPFAVSVLVHLAVMLPITRLFVPNENGQPASAGKDGRRSIGPAATAFARRYWPQALALTGALYAFFTPLPWLGAVLLSQPIPAAIVLIWWIASTDNFKKLWATARARNAMLLGGLAASVYYPLQFMLIPKIADAAAGPAGKAQVMGELLGALFFGQLIATASTTKLPKVRLPLWGAFDTTRLLQGSVLAIAAAWSAMLLFPGSWLGAAAVAAGAGTLMWASGRFMDEARWVRFLGLGFAGVALPWLLPASAAAAFLGLLAAGLFYGPASVGMSNQFYGNIDKKDTEKMVGTNGSIFNAAIAFGFSILTLLSNWRVDDHAGLMGDAAKLFIGVGVVFFLVAAKALPGLAKKEDKK